ncbi:hypothetical protein LMG31841_04778 [Paraburkholderia saeva]|uniref:LysR substrate-binding domain-containing protein n=1 Tax=Paraburkholderia saeva TaxID=2777537 RepID=A0A9N8X396_9BURK|nr:hypothetical protein LMG31841_04778 [Paraburkholderia saeva]
MVPGWNAVDPYVLHLRKGKQQCDVAITGALDSNEGQVIVAAGRAGLGIVIQPLYILYGDIVAGRLIPVLEEWQLPPLTVNLAYQSRRYQPAKICVFIDFLVERVRTMNLEEQWTTVSPRRTRK